MCCVRVTTTPGSIREWLQCTRPPDVYQQALHGPTGLVTEVHTHTLIPDTQQVYQSGDWFPSTLWIYWPGDWPLLVTPWIYWPLADALWVYWSRLSEAHNKILHRPTVLETDWSAHGQTSTKHSTQSRAVHSHTIKAWTTRVKFCHCCPLTPPTPPHWPPPSPNNPLCNITTAYTQQGCSEFFSFLTTYWAWIPLEPILVLFKIINTLSIIICTVSPLRKYFQIIDQPLFKILSHTHTHTNKGGLGLQSFHQIFIIRYNYYHYYCTQSALL